MICTDREKSLNPVIRENRIGFVKFPREILQYSPEDVAEIFSHLLVVRAESVVYDDTIHYAAFCEFFEPVKMGECVPWYTFENKQKGDSFEITGARLDEYQGKLFGG